jgi:hypothetical protein
MFQRLVCRVAVISLVLSASAMAQTATQVVRFQVNAINQLAVTGSPAPLVVNSATAGSEPQAVTNDGTSYGITTNESNQKITASIDQSMPAGVSLAVALAAPTGAFSTGSVELGTAAADVVTGISSVKATSLPITYRLSAAPAAGMSAAAVRTVTFTIVSGA